MRRLLVVAASATLLLVAGCGDEEATTPVPTIGLESIDTTDTYSIKRCSEWPKCEDGGGVDNPAAAPDADPADTLTAYFDDLAAGDTASAWKLLSSDVQEQFGGFDTWSAGVENRESTELGSLSPAESSKEFPAFDVEINTVENTPCGISAGRVFTGTWTLQPNPNGNGDWRIATAEQTLVSGPPDLEVVCVGSGY